MTRRVLPLLLRSLRRLVPAVVACVVAMALVAGVLRSGASVFFCAGMSRLAAHACCEEAKAEAPHEGKDAGSIAAQGPAVDEGDRCCTRLELARLPQVTERAPEPVRAAPLLTVLPRVAVTTLSTASPASFVRRPDRTAFESPPPTAPERCALHRVFLI
jgi:hypothetical protein